MDPLSPQDQEARQRHRLEQESREARSFGLVFVGGVVLACFFLGSPILVIIAVLDLFLDSRWFRILVQALPGATVGYVLAGLTLTGLVATTVVRRRGARRWLADPAAQDSQLTWTVVSWSLLRAIVFMVGVGMTSAALDISNGRPARPEGAPSRGGVFDPLSYPWPALVAVVISSLIVLTTFSSILPIRRYSRRAARRAADAAAGPPPTGAPPQPPPGGSQPQPGTLPPGGLRPPPPT